MTDYDRFSDAYDPEPDYDRPTRAEAEADMAEDDWALPPAVAPQRAPEGPQEPEDGAEWTESLCPICGADIPPHAPDCPAGQAEQPDDVGEDF